MAGQDVTTNIVAKADFSDLIGNLNRVTASLTKLQQQVGNSNRILAGQIGQMNKSFAETLRSTGQFSTQFVSLTSDVEKFGSQLDKGQLKLNQYFKVWQDHSKTSAGLIRDLSKQQVQLQNAVVQPLGKNAQGLMQYNVHIPQGLDLIKNKTALAKQELQIMNKVMQQGAGQLINWGKNTQWAGRQLTVGLTVPIAAFGKAAADAFKQADEQLVRLTKVYGGLTATSATELAKIRKDVAATAAELSKSYGVSYKDTLGLAADIAATGKQGDDLLGSMKETSRLAVLGEVDRQDAMKATLAIQNAFKQNTDQLAESINFLNSVENQTSTTLDDLITAIPKAGPVIQGMGGSVKDLALYLTAMKEGGINATEGANALKSSIASLINPTKVATGMFADFGIDLKGIVTKNAGDLTATILELQGALDTLNPLQKQQAIEQLFGKFQFARMNALFANLGKQGSQTLQVLDLMKASSQELASVANREIGQLTESASGKYRRAVEGLKADLAGIGDQFLNISTHLINFVDGIIKFTQHLPGPIKQVLGFMGMLTAAAGPLIMLTGVLGNFFGYIIKGAYHFKSLFKGGEGWKLLTPEIIAANNAGSLIEKTFYSDAKAAAVLKQAIANLSAEIVILQQKANAGAISTLPTLQRASGMITGGGDGREVNPNHPLISAQDTRSMSHLIQRNENQPNTMFGVVPGAPKVNQKISDNPQMYMQGDLPKIPGLTSIKGVSTGVVAEEAAKWHSMTAAIAMQSEAELKILKQEIETTGTITAGLSDSYEALLPQMSLITKKAAQETAAIVAELQASKITVDQARAKVIALNAEIEAMLGSTATSVASGMGRNIDITKVPLVDQPVIDSAGKSNMKELVRPGRTRDLLNNIARKLGVKTYGAPYSIETTIPKKFAMGGKVFYNNGDQVPGPNVNADVVPAMLTPGEFVIRRGIAQQDPEGMRMLNEGLGTVVPIQQRKVGGSIFNIAELLSNVQGRASLVGGVRQRARSKSRPGEWSSSGPSSRQLYEGQERLTYHSLHRSGSESSWNRLKGYGQVAPGPDDVILHGASSDFRNRFGHLPKGRSATNKVSRKDLEDLGINAGGLFEEGYILPDNFVVFRGKNIAGKKFNSSLESLDGALTNLWPGAGPEDMTSLAISLEQLKVDEEIAKKILSDAAKILNQRVTSKVRVTGDELGDFINEAQVEAIKSYGSGFNGGGKVPGYRIGGGIPWIRGGVSKEIEAAFKNTFAKYPNGQKPVTYNPAGKPAGRYPMPKSYYQELRNDDVAHGPLQIGRYQPSLHVRNRYVAPMIRYRGGKGYEKEGTAPAFEIGNLESRAKSALFAYMQGDYSRINDKAVQEYLSTLRTKFTGTLHRGVSSYGSLPPVISELIKQGKWSDLIGKEFIMRRSSWSKNPDTAKGFLGTQHNNLLITANVKNRNAVPASDLFPDLTFQTPGGPVKVNESEVYMGGKFKVVSAEKGKIQVEAVYDAAREKGGPVNSGRPYLVGEKGPELFIPRNSGTIIPRFAGGGMVSQMVGGTAGYMGGMSIGNSLGGETGSMIGGMVGSMAVPMALSAIGSRSAKAAPGVSKLSAALTVLKSIPGPTMAVAGLVTLGLTLKNVNDRINEHRRIVTLGFAPTDEVAGKIGLKFKSLSSQVKEYSEATKVATANNIAFYASVKSAGIQGLNLTVKQLQDLKKSVKQDFPDYIKIFNAAKPEEVIAKAKQLKAQFIAGGMSADKASQLIYGIVTSSDKAFKALSVLGNEGFGKIKDKSSAASASIQTFNNLLSKGNVDQLSAGFDQLLNSVQSYEASLIGTKDSSGKQRTELDAMNMAFEKLNTSSLKNVELGSKGVDALTNQNLTLGLIVNKSDTAAGAFAKIKLYLAGADIDLKSMNSEMSIAIVKATELANSQMSSANGLFGPIQAKINKLNESAKNATKRSQLGMESTKDSLTDQIKKHQKIIDQIKEQADARIKAIQRENESENTLTQIKKKQLEYQQALASGDMATAAQAQLDIQSLNQNAQSRSAIDSINDKADRDTKKQQDIIDALQSKIDGLQKQMASLSKKATKETGEASALQDLLNRAEQAARDSQNGITGKAETANAAKIAADLTKAGFKDMAKQFEFQGPVGYGIQKTYGDVLEKALTADGSLSVSDKEVLKYLKETNFNGDIESVKKAKALQNIAPLGGYKPYNPDVPISGFLSPDDIKKLKNPPKRKALGGYISGSGTGTSDSIPAMLSNGEYVINAASVQAAGLPLLNRINKMAAGGLATRYNIPNNSSTVANSMPGFKNGGMVNSGNATMGATYNITNNINGYDGDLNQLSSIVTQKTINAIRTMDSVGSTKVGTNRMII